MHGPVQSRSRHGVTSRPAPDVGEGDVPWTSHRRKPLARPCAEIAEMTTEDDVVASETITHRTLEQVA